MQVSGQRRRYGDATEPDLRLAVARALVNKGLALGELGRAGEAIGAYEEADRRFGDESAAELASIDLREQVARALVNKAETLLRLERLDDAIAACEEFGERFGDDVEPEFDERITIVRDRSRSR